MKKNVCMTLEIFLEAQKRLLDQLGTEIIAFLHRPFRLSSSVRTCPLHYHAYCRQAQSGTNCERRRYPDIRFTILLLLF